MAKVTLCLGTPEWTISTVLGPFQHEYTLFIFLFVFRYLRLLVHVIGFWLYKPEPVRLEPSVSERDCAVIVPTMDPTNRHFRECLSSILRNQPATVHIVTVGEARARLTEQTVESLRAEHGSNIPIHVSCTSVANKRHQLAHVLPYVRDRFTILVDDHVFWPSSSFLRSAIAPFEDLRIGGVATKKRVRRSITGFGMRAFWNFIGALYLERHNFEIRATNAIDGGVFVISGRTCLYRTSIVQDPSFLSRFVNERYFFGLCGPLHSDDDNFITRWLVTHGWGIKVQDCEDSVIETELVWTSQPWCVYAVYISQLVNLALFFDSALLYTLARTDLYSARSMTALVMWILTTKMVKLVPYFQRQPRDLIFLPGYFAFAYLHSFIRLYALLTFWNNKWEGRDLDSINRQALGPANPPPSTTDLILQDEFESSISDPAPRETKGITSYAATTKHLIETPWGLVDPGNLHRTPANVLSDLRPQTSWPRGFPDVSRHSQGSGEGWLTEVEAVQHVHWAPLPMPESLETSAYWSRVEDCERIHSQEYALRHRRCDLLMAR